MTEKEKKKKKKFVRRGSKSGSSVGSTSERNGDMGGSSTRSKKSFKRVRRMFSGKSKKKKAHVQETPSQVGDDDSNVVGVVDIQQKEPVVPLSEEKKPYILKVALLLVDSVTRRFELLQLEFDSEKALVSDALSQITLHVTEKVLRGQSYEGVCASDAAMKGRAERLFSFCKGNDVLVAVPTGTPASDCAKLANPILNDDKVLAMLNASGIDASPWKKVVVAAPTTRAAPETREIPQQTPPSVKLYTLTELLFYMLLAVIAFACVGQVFSTPGLVGPEKTWFRGVEVPNVWDTCRSFCDAGESTFERLVIRKTQEELQELVE